ncbi:MAG: peroxiredoxin [Burkholderiaceae bacterium]|nr:peroxiredoxin [Burkholderiaceae bacterium]
MNRRHVSIALLSLASWPAAAQLEVGVMAPDFNLRAALDGREIRWSLGDALARGPVVLYFFPAAYSDGCSLEAHTFAEAMADFQAAGASVVGVSADDLQTLLPFSKQACQGKFPVASDADQRVMRTYDAVMRTRPEFATRVSFVIAPDGRIVFTYKSLEPTRHVGKTLEAVRQLKGMAVR